MSRFDGSSTPPPPSPPPRPARMKPGHWILLVLGVLLAIFGGILLALGVTAVTLDAAQRDGAYITFETSDLQTSGYALRGSSLTVDEPGALGPDLPPPGEIASLKVRATSSVPGQEIFVGIGPTSEVSDYLQDVPHAVLHEVSWHKRGSSPDVFSRPEVTVENLVDGTSLPDDPVVQPFWVQSAAGAESQEILWDLEPGQWSLVIMNADASRPVWVDLEAGIRSDLAAGAIGSVGAGIILAGVTSFTVGLVLVLFGVTGLGRSINPGLGSNAATAQFETTVYPARLTGHFDQSLSRWLWLVKWILAIPHYIILALLGFAVLLTTISAGFVILFTGRYPRSWFAFSVGVLRWTWRVGFYTYAALGTDRYPPFTLAIVPYPANFEVAYPPRLSRGLVLVKWWLLAIPHLVIVGILTTGGMGATWAMSRDTNIWVQTTGGAPSLLSVLVLIAAVILLFTARYRAGLFALIMGVNRWGYRVSTYVLLLRDEYPPFRLDQGPVEPVSPAGENISSSP